MGIKVRIFIVAVMLFVLASAGLVSSHFLTSVLAEDPPAAAQNAAGGWKVKTFIVASDTPNAAKNLGAMVAEHLNGNDCCPNARATDVRLLLSYKDSTGMLATLVYRVDADEHHYTVSMQKIGSTGDHYRAELEVAVEKLLNTAGATLRSVAQDSFFDGVIVGVVCEVK